MAELDLQKQMAEDPREHGTIAKALLSIQQLLKKIKTVVSRMEPVVDKLKPVVNDLSSW